MANAVIFHAVHRTVFLPDGTAQRRTVAAFELDSEAKGYADRFHEADDVYTTAPTPFVQMGVTAEVPIDRLTDAELVGGRDKLTLLGFEVGHEMGSADVTEFRADLEVVLDRFTAELQRRGVQDHAMGLYDMTH